MALFVTFGPLCKSTKEPDMFPLSNLRYSAIFFFLILVSLLVGAQESAPPHSTLTEKPTPEVPESCAFFFGGWAGTWSQNMGPIRLWIVSIKPDCSVKFSYVTTTSNDVPTTFTVGAINGGVLALPCGQNGTCSFERKGDQLTAKYTNPFGGRNNGLFQRIN